jgi:hypothetical protein
VVSWSRLTLIVAIVAMAARPLGALAAEPYAAEFDQIRLPAFKAASRHQVLLVVWNRGTATWASGSGVGGVFLSYHWRGRDGRVVEWDGIRTVLPSPIAGGDPRALTMDVVAPSPGDYLLDIAMVREGAAWFGSATMAVRVFAETYLASLLPDNVLPPGPPGTTVSVNVVVRNGGSATWNSAGPAPVRLSYHWYALDGTVLVWDGERSPLDRDMPPGDSRTVAVGIRLPDRVGMYDLHFDLVSEGEFWFADVGSGSATQAVGVPTGMMTQVAERPPQDIVVRPGESRAMTFRIVNAGTRTWPASGVNPVRLSYHLYRGSGGIAVWDGERSALPKDVAPGEEVTLSAFLVAPESTGTYIVNYDLVWEGIAWFDSISPKSPLMAGSLTVAP